MAPPAALKAKPNSRRIWTPNHSTGGIRARRFPFAPNISAPYTPPARLPAPQKTLTELDPESIAELRERITIWDEEADRLEFGTSNGPPPTIDEQLAQLLCKDNLPSKMKQQAALWDPRSDGKVTKGDFRNHIKRLGLKPKSIHEVDDLFELWDGDHSGSIDMDELRDALIALHKDYKRRLNEKMNPGKKAKIASLRARVTAGKDAILATERAENCKVELAELNQVIEARIDVQLGRLITSRGINVSEVIGTWPKSSSSSQKRQLTKADFKHEVSQLGLQQFGQPVSTKQLSLLFDSVDLDGSGYLDLKEASKALKTWQQYGQDATNDKMTKENELKRFKMRAVKKLQYALRDPSKEAEPEPSSPGRNVSLEKKRGFQQAEVSPEASPMRRNRLSKEHGVGEDVDGQRQTSRSTRRSLSALLTSRDDRTVWEKETARQVAINAIRTMDLKVLRRGMSVWDAHWRRQCHTRGVIIGAKYAGERAKVQHAWRDWKLTSRMLRHVQRGLDNVSRQEDAQRDSFRSWSALAKMRLEKRRRDEHLRRVVEPIRQQRLLLAYDIWMANCPPRQTFNVASVQHANMEEVPKNEQSRKGLSNEKGLVAAEVVLSDLQPTAAVVTNLPTLSNSRPKIEQSVEIPEQLRHRTDDAWMQKPPVETIQTVNTPRVEKASERSPELHGFWDSLLRCFHNAERNVVENASRPTIIDASFKARARAKAAARNKSSTRARLTAAQNYASLETISKVSARNDESNVTASDAHASLELYPVKDSRPQDLRTSTVPDQLSARSLSSTSDGSRRSMARNGTIHVPLRPVTAAEGRPLSPETEGRLNVNIAQHIRFLEGFAVTLGPNHPEVVDLSC